MCKSGPQVNTNQCVYERLPHATENGKTLETTSASGIVVRKELSSIIGIKMEYFHGKQYGASQKINIKLSYYPAFHFLTSICHKRTKTLTQKRYLYSYVYCITITIAKF